MSRPTTRPLVSVVTPVLDRVSTISACIASVANQTHAPIEHIVVDGGSSDGTLQVLERHVAPGFRWMSEPDDGMYDAINKGLRLAQGEIVSYLNSDDLYLPWSIEVAVSGLQGGADLVYGDLAVLHRDRETSGLFIQFYRDFDLRYYTHVATIGQPTVFWRRSLVEEIGPFDSTFRLVGDCEYWLRAAVAGAKIAHLDEILAVQVEHSTTLRAAQPDRLKQEFRRLRADYSAFSDAPTWPRVQRLKKSIAWRRRQLQFRRAIGQNDPGRWPRFVRFLQTRRIAIDDRAFLMFMLPAGLRRSRSPWGDPRELERRLMEEIGIDEDQIA